MFLPCHQLLCPCRRELVFLSLLGLRFDSGSGVMHRRIMFGSVGSVGPKWVVLLFAHCDGSVFWPASFFFGLCATESYDCGVARTRISLYHYHVDTKTDNGNPQGQEHRLPCVGVLILNLRLPNTPCHDGAGRPWHTATGRRRRLPRRPDPSPRDSHCHCAYAKSTQMETE